MDEDFDYFYHDEGFGPSIDSVKVPQSSIEKYRGILPDQLLSYWQKYGWSGWGSGIFWTVNPDYYAPVLDAWLGDTDFNDLDNFYVIAISSFGELHLWGEHTANCITVNSPWGMIFPRDRREKIKKVGLDSIARSFFSVRNKEACDQTDLNEEPLFDRAVEKLGRLKQGEMYGFVPALALGGQCKLENLQIVSAVEHLIMLAQFGEKQIMRDIVADAKQAGLM